MAEVTENYKQPWTTMPSGDRVRSYRGAQIVVRWDMWTDACRVTWGGSVIGWQRNLGGDEAEAMVDEIVKNREAVQMRRE